MNDLIQLLWPERTDESTYNFAMGLNEEALDI